MSGRVSSVVIGSYNGHMTQNWTLRDFVLSLNAVFFCQIHLIWSNQSFLAIHGTCDCLRNRWHRNLSGLSERASDLWIQLPSKFWQWLTFLTNLTNLTNLLSRNLGKTQWFSYRKRSAAGVKYKLATPPLTTRCIIVPLPYIAMYPVKFFIFSEIFY